MADQQKPYREPKETVLAVLMTRRTRKSKFITRLAQWDDGPVVLEKRQMIMDATTKKERTGRCRGFTGREFLGLVRRADEIEKLYAKHDSGFRLGEVLDDSK